MPLLFEGPIDWGTYCVFVKFETFICPVQEPPPPFKVLSPSYMGSGSPRACFWLLRREEEALMVIVPAGLCTWRGSVAVKSVLMAGTLLWGYSSWLAFFCRERCELSLLL